MNVRYIALALIVLLVCVPMASATPTKSFKEVMQSRTAQKEIVGLEESSEKSLLDSLIQIVYSEQPVKKVVPLKSEDPYQEQITKKQKIYYLDSKVIKSRLIDVKKDISVREVAKHYNFVGDEV